MRARYGPGTRPGLGVVVVSARWCRPVRPSILDACRGGLGYWSFLPCCWFGGWRGSGAHDWRRAAFSGLVRRSGLGCVPRLRAMLMLDDGVLPAYPTLKSVRGVATLCPVRILGARGGVG